MSTHPNAILQLTITPPEGKGEEVLAKMIAEGLFTEDATSMTIGDVDYNVTQGDYHNDWQVGGDNEEEIHIFKLVTYGYGERIAWQALQTQKDALEAWAKNFCAANNCTHAVYVTANYW